ncbi:DNA phosphorothioation system sulfurtransferase DndC, partial [Geitlerinema sp. P-1104]|uniref:DNA phosphorothioation system sulfurtransferase DndC n=1 Tax=Geitlerinema sp. P-1104 TaxID=2546230 RepID=UPI0014776C29
MSELKLEISSLKNRTTEEFFENLKNIKSEIQELYRANTVPWVLGYSGGKDSTATVQLVWSAIAELPQHQRHKAVHIITTDTLVENPIVSAWVTRSLEFMQEAADEQRLPFCPHLLKPSVKNTFWVCLMGKGYPAPRNKFRWCTSRLKVDPSNRFIRDVVRENGEAIVVLGTRKTESISRAIIMEKRDKKRVQERLCPHPNLPNSLLYTPIEEWRTDEVWTYLMQGKNPWGYSNKQLYKMYRGATADTECPLVIDSSTPSCGSSRFGCWVCTLVNQDKSMEAMIQNDEEKEWMKPLLDIRNELDLKNDRDRRDFRRIHGNVQLFERNKNGEMSVEPIPGPYTKKWREHWLRRVLEAQETVRR